MPQIIIGAFAQAARHSSSTSVNAPSGVVCPGLMPSFCSMWCRISYPPRSVGRRDVAGLGAELDDRIGQVTELVLRDVQHRQQRRLLVRIARQDPLDALLRLR